VVAPIGLIACSDHRIAPVVRWLDRSVVRSPDAGRFGVRDSARFIFMQWTCADLRPPGSRARFERTERGGVLRSLFLDGPLAQW
jgi:hypothetical protein